MERVQTYAQTNCNFSMVPGSVSQALLGGAGRGATGGSSQERRGGRRSCFCPRCKTRLGPNIEQNGLSLGLEIERWRLEIEQGGELSRLEKLQIAYTTQSCFKKYQADENTMIISTQ